MAIYLDGRAVRLAGDDLRALLEDAQKTAGREGRVIVEVELDGRLLIGDELEKAADASIASSEVRLTSAEPRELASSTLEQVREGLAEAKRAATEAAELLQSDKRGEAMKRIARAVELWQQAQHAIDATTGLVGIKLEDRAFDGKPVAAFGEGLAKQLASLKDLLTANDTLALADSLAYEWPETIDRWDRFVAEVIVWVRESSPK